MTHSFKLDEEKMSQPRCRLGVRLCATGHFASTPKFYIVVGAGMYGLRNVSLYRYYYFGGGRKRMRFSLRAGQFEVNPQWIRFFPQLKSLPAVNPQWMICFPQLESSPALNPQRVNCSPKQVHSTRISFRNHTLYVRALSKAKRMQARNYN